MREAGPAENLETLEQTGTTSPTGLTQQGTQKFGGVRVGNGPTEDEAEIIEHDQLSQHSEEGDEVSVQHQTSARRCHGNLVLTTVRHPFHLHHTPIVFSQVHPPICHHVFNHLEICCMG